MTINKNLECKARKAKIQQMYENLEFDLDLSYRLCSLGHIVKVVYCKDNVQLHDNSSVKAKFKNNVFSSAPVIKIFCRIYFYFYALSTRAEPLRSFRYFMTDVAMHS